MVDTYKDPKEAFKALAEECYKPKTSTSRTTHKVEKVVATTVVFGGAAVAVGTVFALPALIAVTGMSALALGATGGAFSYGVTDVVPEAYSGCKDRKDVPCMPPNVPLVDRTRIKSLLRRDDSGTPLTLAQVAGNRAGTRGHQHLKDLLEAIVAHYQLAMRTWSGPPYRPGIQSPSPHSCQEAEDLYRKFVEVDYHLSKTCAYAEKLEEVAHAYVTFCKRNAITLEGYFDDSKRRVNLVLEQSEDWHHHHCHVDDHCYRTSKLSRVGKSKAA
jgi:hypothetical protein